MLTIKRFPLASAAWLVQDFCCAREMAARHAACLVHELCCVKQSQFYCVKYSQLCCVKTLSLAL